MPLDPCFPRLFLRILFPTASGWGYRFNHHYNDGWKLKYRHYTHNTQLSLDNTNGPITARQIHDNYTKL